LVDRIEMGSPQQRNVDEYINPLFAFQQHKAKVKALRRQSSSFSSADSPPPAAAASGLSTPTSPQVEVKNPLQDRPAKCGYLLKQGISIQLAEL